MTITAGVAAAAAVSHVGRKASLTTVAGQPITIAERGLATRDRAAALDATRHAIRSDADVAAEPAVIGIVHQIGFAIGRHATTFSPTLWTHPDLTSGTVTDLESCVTGDVAGSAMRRIGLGARLATIVRHTIAVRVPGLANRRAAAGDALSRAVRIQASFAADPTSLWIVIQLGLTAVLSVAIAITHHALDATRPTNAVGARSGALHRRTLKLAAAAAHHIVGRRSLATIADQTITIGIADLTADLTIAAAAARRAVLIRAEHCTASVHVTGICRSVAPATATVHAWHDTTIHAWHDATIRARLRRQQLDAHAPASRDHPNQAGQEHGKAPGHDFRLVVQECEFQWLALSTGQCVLPT
ncbi:MAG: hypothetical protein ABW321_30915 [Polyangiales bacterium]